MGARFTIPKWGELAAALGVVVLFVVMLAGFFVPTYEGTDENGYMLTGKRLAAKSDVAKRTSDPYEFISGNWVEAQPGIYYAKYPVGYPALVALAYRLGGADATFWVNPVLATLAVLGIFVLGRALWNPLLGLFAAILLATNPLHAQFSLSALSHTGSLCCAVWAMYFTWRCWERGGTWNAMLAGALAAYGISVRYTEALLFIPIAVAVVWRWRTTKQPVWRDAAALFFGAGVAILPLVIQHWIAYGSPFITGYTLCKESTGFGWKWFQENWWLMLERMSGSGLVLLFPLGLAGLVLLCLRDVKRGVLLSAWVWPSLLLYSAYYWAPQGDGWGYVRFFVSVFPALILGAVALLDAAVRDLRYRAVAVGAVVLVIATVNLRQTTQALDKRVERWAFTRTTGETVAASLPAGSVIFATDGLLNFVEYWGDYRLYSEETFERNAIANKLKVLASDDPHPFQRERAQRIASLLGNRNDAQLVTLQRERIGRHVAGGRRVALLTNADGFRRWRGRLGEWFDFKTISVWQETTTSPKKEVRQTPWALYELVPRRPADAPVDVAAVEKQIDLIQYRLRRLRETYDSQFPGARDSQTRISDAERELRDAQALLKKLKAQPKPATPNVPVSFKPGAR